jgi:undecaprenyl-diphosphatase
MQRADGSPLWAGSVVEERIRRPLSLVTVVVTQPDFNVPRDALAQSLGGANLKPRIGAHPSANWDGRVLLARDVMASVSPPGQ